MRTVALLKTPADLAAAKLAVRLGDAIAISVAPDGEELRRLLSGSGVGRAIRLWDEAIEGVDYLGIALALAGAVRAIGDIDVVVCGDSGSSAVGPALAERLGWPHLGRVLDGWVEDGKLFARRRFENAFRKLSTTPPAVLCVNQDASLAVTAGELAIETWSLSEAALTAADLSYRKSFRPQAGEAPKRQPKRFPDVAALLARLRADGVVK